MKAGSFLLWLAWGFSLCFQIPSTFIEPYQPSSLILCVLTLAIMGLIHRLDDLERLIVGHGQEPELTRELDAEGQRPLGLKPGGLGEGPPEPC